MNKNVPKIEFRYSWIYDQRYRNSPGIKEFLKKSNLEKYPSETKVKNYVKRMEKEWKKCGKRILKELTVITGLKWNEEIIICYVVGIGRPFSDPLTMKLFKNKNDFIDTLIHELIHQLFIQKINRLKIRKYLKYRNRKYRNESIITRNHILLHSIHKKLYLKFFDKRRLNNDIKKCQNWEDYKSSWEIVEKTGADNMIRKFKEVVK